MSLSQALNQFAQNLGRYPSKLQPIVSGETTQENGQHTGAPSAISTCFACFTGGNGGLARVLCRKSRIGMLLSSECFGTPSYPNW